MDRDEIERLIDSLYGVPQQHGDDEPQTVAAVLRVVREMGYAAFSDEGLQRLLDAQTDVINTELRR